MSLKFSDTSVEKAGLLQVCEANLFGDNGYGQITGNASRLAIITNYLNEGYSRYSDIAMRTDGTWQFDDTSFTTDPLPTADLVTGQQSYGLATTHIQILEVEIKDAVGNWHSLKQIDELDFSQNNDSLSAYYDNAGTPIKGTPIEYNIIGPSIFLYPTPSYMSTNGLKVRVQRPPNYFATTDTTNRSPGFTETHHTYLSDYATYKYAASRTMPDLERQYGAFVAVWESKTIPEFYGQRNKKFSKVMTGKKIRYI